MIQKHNERHLVDRETLSYMISLTGKRKREAGKECDCAF